MSRPERRKQPFFSLFRRRFSTLGDFRLRPLSLNPGINLLQGVVC